tara:strand:- start:1058 stop:1249 length:192 start_codon:yes stop_codon:yes gene_type:complete
MKAFFNSLFHAHERISYRRLMVFGAACGLLMVDKLSSENWVWIACAFIGGEALQRSMASLKGS